MFPTGKTALHWAALVNSLDVTKELLKNGAKKDAQDEKVSKVYIYFSCELGSQEAEEFHLTAYLVKFTRHLQGKLFEEVDGQYVRSLYVAVEILCARYFGLFTIGPSWLVGKASLADRACMEKVRLSFAASKGWILAGA